MEVPIHIGFIDSWLQSAAQGSGTAVGISGLQLALQQFGHRVTRLSPDESSQRNLLARRLWFNVQLPRLLQQNAFDLLVGFDVDGCLYSPRKRTVPFVCSIKGVAAEESQQETGMARWLLWSLGQVEGYNARHADLVLATSRYCRHAIQCHYGVRGNRIRLLPEGIDLARWQRINETIPRDSDGFTILCVARQYRRKHIQDLLRALVLVRETIPQVHAILVGDGPEHIRLLRLVNQLDLEDTVEMLGAIPTDDEVARQFRRADIFCLPTIQEGFGIVFLEAMAAGLPIVTTRSAAIPEVVPHGKAGVLIPPCDVSALASELTKLLLQPKKRMVLGRFGQEHVKQFDWKQVAQKFLLHVQPLLSTKK